MNTIILEEDSSGKYQYDLYDKLANDRKLFITDHIDDQLATEIVASLILKNKEFKGNKELKNSKSIKDKNKYKITLFINSPGGDIRNVFMVYDIMQQMDFPIETICLGEALNESALLLAAGTKSMRKMVPHAMVQLAQLDFAYVEYGNVKNAESYLKRQKKDNEKFLKCLSLHCGKTVESMKNEISTMKFLSAQEAVNFGLVDIVTKTVK